MKTWLKSHVGKSVVAAALAVLVVGGLAFAVAGPLSSSSSTTITPSSARVPANAAAAANGQSATVANAATGAELAAGSGRVRLRPLLRRLLTRSVHASLIVKTSGGQYVTVDFDRGVVKSVSSTSITIERPDGVTVSASITSATKFRRTTEAALADGDHVAVVQVAGSARYVVAIGKKSGTGTRSATSSIT